MKHLQELIKNYSNENLLEQYLDHQEEYTPEALKIIKKEIVVRNIRQEEIDIFLRNKNDLLEEKQTLDTKDFAPFDHTFSHTDIILAIAVLRDSKVVFYVDNPASTDTIPLESAASRRFGIHVHKDSIPKAHELLDEHFIKEDGLYIFKHAGAIDRLKAFSFHDLHLNEFEAAEKIEVSLTSDERRVIIYYGNRLLNEVDTIELSQERVVFYYDSIESLIKYLKGDNNKLLSRSDLLTILEILQIYCEDEVFPSTMSDSISSLLGFFMES